MDFQFPIGRKISFYLRYFTDKVFALWWEVRRPKVRMFLYEMIYSAAKFIDYKMLVPSPFKVEHVDTIFGSFRIRSGTVDMSNVSPAFERPDVDRMMATVKGLMDSGKKVLFLDVGADIGTFAISVGNRFKSDDRLSIIAFEPSAESFRILNENVALNGLQSKVRTVNAPLYSVSGQEMAFSFNASAPGSSGLCMGPEGAAKDREGLVMVTTTTIDEAVGPEAMAAYDALVMKIDVEGVESEVLEGGPKTFDEAAEVHLLVEDFINLEIIDYLKRKGAAFKDKLTPYNSFWRM